MKQLFFILDTLFFFFLDVNLLFPTVQALRSSNAYVTVTEIFWPLQVPLVKYNIMNLRWYFHYLDKNPTGPVRFLPQ